MDFETMQPVRWGVLGASKFALEHMAPAIHAAKGANLIAAASRRPEGAAQFQSFAPECDIVTGYDTVLARDDIDAVYIPLPHTLHAQWSIKAMQAGKHVLCEKPISMSVVELDTVIAARDQSGLHVAEAYMIAHHPQWHRLRHLISDGAIGEVMQINAAFSYDNSADLSNIRNDQSTGGGALPDIGVYAIGSAQMMMDAPLTDIKSAVRYENGYDTYAHVTGQIGPARYAGYVSMRMHLHQAFEVHGTKGLIRLTAPFNPGIFGESRIELHQPSLGLRVERFPVANQYTLQVEAFGHTIQTGAAYPWTLEHARRTQQALDDIYAAAQPI